MTSQRSQTVLIGIINRKKDLDILLNKRWYRIPVSKLPRQKFSWIAFYQTARLGTGEGKLIKYYARANRPQKLLRKDLLTDEGLHPNAGALYYKFSFSEIKRLTRPIKNTTSMRMTFGFTTLARLLKFRTLPGLFGVRPLEKIFRRLLKKNDIPFIAEYPIRRRGRTRYRLDMAIFCKRGQINIECDNPKYHSGRRLAYDKRRNEYLSRRKWRILRFSDEDILLKPKACLNKLNHSITMLGGHPC